MNVWEVHFVRDLRPGENEAGLTIIEFRRT